MTMMVANTIVILFFQPFHHKAVHFARHDFRFRQQKRAERRGNGEGNQQRPQNCDDVGDAQRRENAAFDAAEIEQGNEH